MKKERTKKPSKIIEEWVEMWIMWMKNNSKVKDENLDFKERRKAAEECEKLIDKEYILVEQFDNFFKKNENNIELNLDGNKRHRNTNKASDENVVRRKTKRRSKK